MPTRKELRLETKRSKLNARAFMSYSSKQLPVVMRFVQHADAMGVVSFLAERAVLPGESLANCIFPQIDMCDVFVLFWSKDAAKSEWVSEEIARAWDLKKRIVLVRLDDEPVPPFLSGVKWISKSVELVRALHELEVVLRRATSEKRERSMDRLLTACLGAAAVVYSLRGRGA